MKKKIVSTLVVIGLLIVLGGYSYNVQYRQKPEIKHFTAFFSVTGRPLGTQNDIKKIIADEIGADCEENWLVGQSKEEVLNSYIASGEYPDFILGEKALLEADALIPMIIRISEIIFPTSNGSTSGRKTDIFTGFHRFVCLRERMLK